MAVTEDTVTDLIGGYLRDNGIDALTQITESTPQAYSQPDYKVENGGTFWGEAKWESKKWQGFGEARDYGQLPGAEGAFLISYPDELKNEGIQQGITGDIEDSSLGDYTYSCAFLRRDSPTDTTELELEEIPGWIESNIKEEREPYQDPEQVISVLRQMARRLNDELTLAPEENIFRNVLGTSTDDEEERQAARETAGFLLINQITFYRVLSAEKGAFPDIDPQDINRPEDLSSYFELVLEQDYTPVFNFRIVEDLPKSATSVLQDTIKSVYGLSPESVDHDVLGKVFHELIPEEPRKKVAAYYTKNEPAEMLAELTIDEEDANVLEPACGSGTLLSASYLRKRDLSDDFDEEVHRQFLEKDITGIDVMPFAAHLSCIHLALQAPVYETDEVNIGIADSTSLQPGSTISPLSFVLPDNKAQAGLDEYQGDSTPDTREEDRVEAGSTTLDASQGEEMELGYADLVIMNPPFSRQESVARFRDNYKDTLERRFSRRSDYLHGKMSYSSYFFLLSDKFLKEGGRIAAVIKGTVLNIKSDRGIRRMLAQEYDIEYVFARSDGSNYSEDTDLREVLIIARKGHSEDFDGTSYVLHKGLRVDTNKLQRVSDSLSKGESAARDDFFVQKISVDNLNINNLFSPLSLSNPEVFSSYERVADGLELTSLDSLDVGLIRGIGSAGYGVMDTHPEASLNDPDAYQFSDRDVWVTDEEKEDEVIARHRHTDETIAIPRDNLAPNLRRFSGRGKTDVSDIPEYVVKDPNFDRRDKYVDRTDADNIHKKWPDRVGSRQGHIALVRRVNVTAPGSHHLAYYSDEKRLYPDMMWVLPKATKSEAKILCAWFDSTFGWLKSISDRVETEGGFLEWHRYIVKEYRAPSLQQLSEDDRDRLIEAFNEWGDVDTPPMYKQLALNADPDNLTDDELEAIETVYDGLTDELGNGFEPRKTLDKAIMGVAGLDDDEQREVLDGFYGKFLLELVSLKGMMGSQ